jgi:formate dehydrogenase subunit gamma
MAKPFAGIRIAIVVLMVAAFAVIADPAVAQQPTSVNPTASSVKEDQLLKALGPGGTVGGRVSIPDQKSANLIQPGGPAWREFHEGTMHWIGGIAILGMLALIVIFYLLRGMVRIDNGRSGRTIVRFNAFERFVHWMTAGCFVILGLTGLNITFGKSLLLPLFGAEGFTALSQWGKYAHNYLSFPFTIGVVLTFLIWIAGNIPAAVDREWLSRGGGMFGKDHPPAGRFNAGQKLIYWIVIIGGTAVAVTGYLLMFPFYATDIAGMQLAQVVHGVVAVLFVAAMLGHIYIGTIGMEGAFEAMGTGTVDVNWAKQHHSLWLAQEQAKANPSASHAHPAATPAE